ncbi:hypothetical protein GY45DRAFT_627106 [Cubamyces sp. BRFM 1775]|nr:hypothetical protein GY45DRAFT_627106 [Cubamyces sp. BRFM 1775]
MLRVVSSHLVSRRFLSVLVLLSLSCNLHICFPDRIPSLPRTHVLAARSPSSPPTLLVGAMAAEAVVDSFHDHPSRSCLRRSMRCGCTHLRCCPVSYAAPAPRYCSVCSE